MTAESADCISRTGPFSPTNKVDYCDPKAGGHDD